MGATAAQQQVCALVNRVAQNAVERVMPKDRGEKHAVVIGISESHS